MNSGYPKYFLGHPSRLLGAVVLATFCLCVPARLISAETQVLPVEEDIFQSTNLLRISVEISEGGVQSLRASQPSVHIGVKPQARATVTEGGRTYRNVEVQLKGFSTFRPIDLLPSLTLNFSASSQGKFHGLSKISLNNSLQDPSRLQEKFSRELFTSAGVPVPRADYAMVTLNGRELGLYVLVEGFDKEFLRRHFKRAGGTFYEGGVLQDIDRPLKTRVGRESNSESPIKKLISAAREPAINKRWLAINEAVDMNRFISMIAMEAILCHSDSYSMNRNNYRLYHDPLTDKIVFLPHGMDRVLGTHRSGLDLSIVPPMLGLVARAVLSTPEGQQHYLERVGVLFTNLFDGDRLCHRVEEIDSKISDARRDESSPDYRPMLEPRPDNETGNLCDRIRKRASNLKVQFEHLSEIQAGIKAPTFNENGVAQFKNWMPKLNLSQPEISCSREIREGREVLHLKTSGEPLKTSLRAKLNLPAGNYQLTGDVGIDVGEPTVFAFVLSLIRYSSGRYALEPRPLSMQKDLLSYPIRVGEPRVPEEIEIICDIRAAVTEVWFDTGSLKLIRVE